MEAQCQCGQLRVDYPGETPAVVACHCRACQRRTGAPFAVLAYYPADRLTITGEATRFARTADSGDGFESFFCPGCGSTVYVRALARPEMLGLAVGTMADPAFKAPINSVWEEAKHHWVTIPGDPALRASEAIAREARPDARFNARQRLQPQYNRKWRR